MNDMRLDFEAELNGLDADNWFERVDAISDEHGYFERLGENHVAALLDAGTNLLVTFEDAEYIRKFNNGSAPRGFHCAQQAGRMVTPCDHHQVRKLVPRPCNLSVF